MVCKIPTLPADRLHVFSNLHTEPLGKNVMTRNSTVSNKNTEMLSTG